MADDLMTLNKFFRQISNRISERSHFNGRMRSDAIMASSGTVWIYQLDFWDVWELAESSPPGPWVGDEHCAKLDFFVWKLVFVVQIGTRQEFIMFHAFTRYIDRKVVIWCSSMLSSFFSQFFILAFALFVASNCISIRYISHKNQNGEHRYSTRKKNDRTTFWQRRGQKKRFHDQEQEKGEKTDENKKLKKKKHKLPFHVYLVRCTWI